MENAVIEAVDLRRTFTVRTGWLRPEVSHIDAVRGISLQVGRGELFGLLGQNGAGKTTTIKMLNTLLIPTSGSARVAGFDVVAQAREVRERIGFVFGGDRGLYDRLSALENLRYIALLYRVPHRQQRSRIAELIELVGLTGREHERVQGYSRGMRQRVHLARGLLTSPEVLFLDEPSIGLDPVGARQMRATMADLAASGVTILLTTHYIAEAEELCNRVAVVADGRVRALGSAEELKRRADGRRVLEVEVFGMDDAHLERIRALPHVLSAAVETRGATQLLAVQTDVAVDVQAEVITKLRPLRLGRVDARTPTLEDAYVAIVSGGVGDEVVGSGAVA
jgi:ABC-2 type transport system ATP-binding protein